MSEKYTPVKGDHVRVVLEGEVDYVSETTGFDIKGDVGAAAMFWHLGETIKSIEKIEPPVEAFKPGDVVRSIQYPKHVYSLGSGGYYSHFMEKTYRPLGAFTADEYELVYRP